MFDVAVDTGLFGRHQWKTRKLALLLAQAYLILSHICFISSVLGCALLLFLDTLLEDYFSL
jgi:hypothetical protein